MKMNNYDKIIELAEKENLSGEEKEILSSIINSEKKAKDLYETYKKLSGAVKLTGHLSTQSIGDYVLYKNEMLNRDASISQKAQAIEMHLRECSSCSRLYLELNEEYSGITKFLSSRFEEKPVFDKKPVQEISYKRHLYFPKYIFITLLTIGFIYFGLYLISDFTTPQLNRYAAISDETEFSISRGRATDDFQNSLGELENDNYLAAVRYLNEDIKNDKSDETIFYSYYVLGLTHLKLAEESFLGLFPSYNKADAEKALHNFQKTVKLNNTGEYPNITFNAYFYTAKAYMMLGNKASAVKYLKLVVRLKGSKLNEAREILGTLE